MRRARKRTICTFRQGRLGIQQGLSGEIQSVAQFEEAIAKDPSFAPAYAGLAAAHVARSGMDGIRFGG